MKINTRALLAGFAGICLAGAAHAADVTVGADINSAYVWRGITFNDGFVLQPSVDIASESGIGINVWSNFDLEDYDDALESGEFSEVDLALSYAIPVEGFDLGVGVVEYLFPGAEGSTRELYAEAGMEFVEGFGGGIFIAYDFDEIDDVYGNVSLAYGMDLDEKLSMELSGVLGAAGSDFAAYYDGDGSGLFDYNVALGAAYALNDVTELGAFLAYTDSLDSDVLVDKKSDVDFYGGFSLYYAY